MSNEQYDVFISYRRNGGSADARLIRDNLEKRGYSVFLDVVNIGAGAFDEKLFDFIEGCTGFVLVLSPGALDGCSDEEDWVRLEVEKAHDAHKNIIPVLLEGFTFPKTLPDSLRFLKRQAGLPISRVYFDAFMDRLHQYLQTKPVTPKEPHSDTVIVRQTGEISDSWTDVLKAIDNGTIRRLYNVGDCVQLNLGRFGKINMQLAGFDLDERADGKGKSATTWIAREVLSKPHEMHKDCDDWHEAGWERSDLRRWLQNDVLPAFPDGLRNRLIPVKKRQDVYNDGWEEQTTEDRLWIPDYKEVFGKGSLYYGLFEDQDDKREKKHFVYLLPWFWWLRSATNNHNASGVRSSGSKGSYDVYHYGMVVLGFCL